MFFMYMTSPAVFLSSTCEGLESLFDRLLLFCVDAPASPTGSCAEDIPTELGMYDPDEDFSSWAFKRRYEDSQWQEEDITLRGQDRGFTWPLPGPLDPRSGHGSSCLLYFRRFWPDLVLDRIVVEKNRYCSSKSLSRYFYDPP
jgi:hypothetical protein